MRPRVAWAVVIVATLTMTVSYIDRQTLAVLAPTVRKALDIDKATYGWLASAFSIAYLVGTPVAGWWIDRIGARRGLVGSVLAWSAIAGLHAVVPGFATLFVLRIALGLAESPGFPASAQTVQRAMPPAVRPRAIGLLFTGSSVGAMIAPPLATWLYDQFGWRYAFLGTALVGLSWIPLWVLLVRRRDVRETLDVPAPPREQRVPLRDLLAMPAIQRAILGVFVVAGVNGFWLTWGANILVDTLAVKQEEVGHFLWLPPLCLDAGAILFGDFTARFGRTRALYAVAMLMSSTVALLPLAATPWQMIAIACVSLGGGGALYTLCTADLFTRVPGAIVSFAGSMLAASQSLAYIISAPLVGRASDSYGNYDVPAIVLGACVIPGSLIWILWQPASGPARLLSPRAGRSHGAPAAGSRGGTSGAE